MKAKTLRDDERRPEDVPFLQEDPGGVILRVKVQPRSSQTRIAGIQGDALKITLTAPPVDGAANKMCIEFLSRQIGLTKSDIKIISGENSRLKRIFLPCPDDRTKIKIKRFFQTLGQKNSL
jgi:uncharacterized protein (TIGR00251 family)